MRTQQSLTILLIAASSLVAACSSDSGNMSDSTGMTGMTTDSSAGAMAPPAPTANATLTVAMTGENAPYLTDAEGRALYLFEKDRPDSSTCVDACASDWPPYTAPAAPTASDSSVQSSMISTITRPDGRMQVTYNHMPLYYYARDTGPGTTEGQDVDEYGDEWYLVSPEGKKQEGKD